ncbi:hypothetical protein D3C71_1661240 [compost metagenome]
MSIPALTIGSTLWLFSEANMSSSEPCLRYLVEKVANGPNSSTCLPSIIRVSRCGTDIGGAPTEALPYSLAWWRATRSGLSVIRNWPPTGKPA